MALPLSVVVVTRFQDECLGEALASAQPLGGEIVVVDTARAESTRRVAEQAGAVYVGHEWDDDFSAARNEGLARATRDWVLLLHPDEVVLPTDAGELARELRHDGVFACGVTVQEQHQADQPPPYVESTPLRLYRRSLDIRYVGRLLPTFETPPQDVAEFQGRSLRLASVVLRHHGWHATLTPAKLRWTLKLLDRELADRPGQVGYEIERALVLRRLNDSRAREALTKAAGWLWQARAAEQPPSLNCAELLEFLLGTGPHEGVAPAPFEDILSLALRWFPDSPPVLNRGAEACYQRGDFLQAAVLLDRLLQAGQSGAYDRRLPFQPDVFGDGTRVNLALCLMRLGQLRQAAAVFAQVGPGSAQYARAQDHLQRLAALGVSPSP